MIQRQTDKTLNYMQANGSITYKQMMSVLNINSPRDIIRQLKKRRRTNPYRESSIYQKGRHKKLLSQI